MKRRTLLRHIGIGSAGVVASLNILGSQVMASAPVGGKTPLLSSFHFVPKARRVIYIWLAGGISQFESFENKAMLHRLHDMSPARYKSQCVTACLKPLGEFKRHGESGMEISHHFPHIATLADKLTVIKTFQNFAPAHPQAANFMFTGERLNDKPSLGAWVNYGIGTANPQLPGFVNLGSLHTNASNGFLPSDLHGVYFNTEGDSAVDFLDRPQSISKRQQREVVDRVAALDRLHAHREMDDVSRAHANVYELAYQMHSSIPDVMNILDEPEYIRQQYGIDEEETRQFGTNLLSARRLIERGVRFINITDPGWDHHTGLEQLFPIKARNIDKPLAALIGDLEQRGMLDDTLVVVSSEFGRTPFNEGKIIGGTGRGHNPDAGIVIMAGAGVKQGFVFGETDEFGFKTVRDPISVNDLNATILYALGIDHNRLTFELGGRAFRATGVGESRIFPELFA